ncbi:uncharacterized protein LOC111118926 isoform X5 [Crassostrea virginica]
MEDLKCGFCHLGPEVKSICGKLHYDGKKLAAHHKCMQYSSGLVQYKSEKFGGFEIDKVKKQILRGNRLPCSICKRDKNRKGKRTRGATSGCEIPDCIKTFHYYCAQLDDVAITKRLKKASGEIMYRVFCSEEHYEQFKTKNERNTPSSVKQNNQGEEDAESSEVSSEDREASDEDSDFQCKSDFSLSELENVSEITLGELNVKRVSQSTNPSKFRNCELDLEEPENITNRHTEKPSEKIQNVSERTVGTERKVGQDEEKQQESSDSRIGNIISISTKNAMLKSKDYGAIVGKQCYITAEVRVATPPFTAQKKIIEDDETSNGQGYSSDDEITMETNESTKGSVLQQKINPPSPNHLPEISFESEWEEMTQFSACAVAISSTTMVSPSKRIMIIQRAKEGFDVNHVAIWNTTDSFSDLLTDEYLPHLMIIIRDRVRERNFEEIESLLTDISCQHCHMKYNKHIVDLPDDMVENIGKSILKKNYREEINGEEVLFIDTHLNTLFLKLNDTVDRRCKIRSILLSYAKEFLGNLFDWKENTVASAPLSQSDAKVERKMIKNWMTHQQWNLSESFIYPTDDIFRTANKNQGIEELIVHQSTNGDNKRKVVFVRPMNEIVNYNMFIQELILSCVETEDTLIICHSVPVITRQSLVPVDLPKETQIQIKSAFKPSNKRGISILVIHICNQKQQKLATDISENQQQQLSNNCLFEEAASKKGEHHRNTFSKSLNLEEEKYEDILYIGDVPPDHNLNNEVCIKHKSGSAGEMSARKNKIKKGGECANRSPKKLRFAGIVRTKSRPSNDHGEEDDKSSEVNSDEREASCDDIDYQSPSDSSVSKLENASDMILRELNVQKKKQSLNPSTFPNFELDVQEPENTVMRHTEQSIEKTWNVRKRRVGMGRKAKQDREKQQDSTKTRISNRKSNTTRHAMLKSKDQGAIDGNQCNITAEAHVVTSSFTAQKKIIEGDDKSNGQGYISDEEMVVETNGSTTGSVMQQKSSPPSPNHLPEMSSESEWEEMSQFPEEAYVLTTPFTAQNKVIDGDDTSKGQCYIYNDEKTMETEASTKGSVMQQKSSLPSPNHLPELSSESEWEAMAQFPASISGSETKKKSSISTTTVETIEGITYEGGILSQRANIPVDELETIPPPPPQLVQEPLPPDNYSRVFFDLETTGLELPSEILQLAAICGDQKFSCYVLPTSSIDKQASRITGLTFDGTILFKRGVPVPAVSLHECLTMFHQWLTAIPKPVLFAHNCRNFDSIILSNAITKSNFYHLSEYISGFCDTLPMLKENISMKTTSFSLETLVRNVLGLTYDAHDAVEDCKYLKKLVEHSSICIDAYYLNYTFTVSYIMSIMKQMETKKSNKNSLSPLITGKVVSKSMLDKISSSGLSMHHLHLAYQRNGFDGIYTLFTTCFQGKVRVTKQKNIITNVANFLQER